MRRLIVTPENFGIADMRRALQLLDCGAERLHLRTVGAAEGNLRTLIEAVPLRYRRRVSIHEHLHLANEYGLGGVHLNSRYPDAPADFDGIVSASCHSIEQLRDTQSLDYVFLSPIFDSISKAGYRAAFSTEQLLEARNEGLISARVIALGGITPRHFDKCREFGFGGVAMLGAAFNPIDSQKFALQYITPAGSDNHIVESVQYVLEHGCRWVQLRMKDATAGDILRVASRVQPLCRQYGAVFLLDDHVELVEAVRADGVHLGRNDMRVDQARSILGPGYIIGATANTAEHIIEAAEAGADYIGLGPLRFTTTKKNLSPTLGYDGYRSIIAQIRAKGIQLPIVGIGGVTPDDMRPMHNAGVQGLAVCNAIKQFLNHTT